MSDADTWNIDGKRLKPEWMQFLLGKVPSHKEGKVHGSVDVANQVVQQPTGERDLSPREVFALTVPLSPRRHYFSPPIIRASFAPRPSRISAPSCRQSLHPFSLPAGSYLGPASGPRTPARWRGRSPVGKLVEPPR